MPRAKKIKFRRSSAGIKQFLMFDPGVSALMQRAGASVAEGARSRGITDSSGDPIPVEVVNGISTWPGKHDRQAAKVTLKHPAGVPLEAKYGILARATTGAGLDWGRKSPRR